jgi:hypothetical protein
MSNSGPERTTALEPSSRSVHQILFESINDRKRMKGGHHLLAPPNPRSGRQQDSTGYDHLARMKRTVIQRETVSTTTNGNDQIRSSKTQRSNRTAATSWVRVEEDATTAPEPPLLPGRLDDFWPLRMHVCSAWKLVFYKGFMSKVRSKPLEMPLRTIKICCPVSNCDFMFLATSIITIVAWIRKCKSRFRCAKKSIFKGCNKDTLGQVEQSNAKFSNPRATRNAVTI